LYSVKTPESDFNAGKILFLDRLQDIQKQFGSDKMQQSLFVTPAKSGTVQEPPPFKHEAKRITTANLTDAVGPLKHRSSTVVYICGPPAMTDQFVAFVQDIPGMDRRRILYEKWW
jgi:NAD(P)H-flavin reductase